MHTYNHIIHTYVHRIRLLFVYKQTLNSDRPLKCQAQPELNQSSANAAQLPARRAKSLEWELHSFLAINSRQLRSS